MTGYIHSMESMGLVDGPGVRAVVFLQGCPLRCRYCHNPDTQSGGGRPVEDGTLVRRLLRFRSYFDRSGGGVTFSGRRASGPAGLSAGVPQAAEGGRVSTPVWTPREPEGEFMGRSWPTPTWCSMM